MANDDDEQLPEQDPWAGLDIDGEIHADDVSSAESGGDIPLTVFPPPDAESSGLDERLDAAQMDVASMAEPTIHEPKDLDGVVDGGHDRGDWSDDTVVGAIDQEPDQSLGGVFVQNGDLTDEEPFDDARLARELGLLDVEGDEEPDAISMAAGEQGPENDGESRAVLSGVFSEDAALDAGLADVPLTEDVSPSADGERLEPELDGLETGQDEESSSIPLAAAVATGAAIAAVGSRPAAVKKKGSGLGQLIGVAMGGLMALPITYAILIWGFHKDPFKFGKQVPPALAFLLPQKLQPGYKPVKKTGNGPNLDAAASLDDLPSADDSTSGEPLESPEATKDATTDEPASSSTTEAATVVAAMDKPAESNAAEVEETAPAPEPVTVPAPAEVREEVVASVVPLAAAEMPAASGIAAPAPADALSGLDAIVADVASPAPTPAAPAEVEPLDLSGVERAAERVGRADEARSEMADPSDPERDRRLVTWYRRLARLGEELVRLETMASDTGHPLSATPAAASEVLDRIRLSETAVADLDRLDGMWLTSHSRKADGVSLVAVLGTARRVGPYWSTAATIAGGNADGTDRSVAIISRVAPPADAGDRVLVSGVMFDGDAVWAADMRPVVAEPSIEDTGTDDEHQEQDAVDPSAE